MTNIPLSQWIKNYDEGLYNSRERSVQCEANWYDWFCDDYSLLDRLNSLAPKLKNIAKSSKVDLEKNYVFFKNNCPLFGRLYDDFRICDLETGKVLYNINPSNGHKGHEGVAELYGIDNEFEKPLVVGTMQDIYNYFDVIEEFSSVDFIEPEEDDEDDYYEDDDWYEEEEEELEDEEEEYWVDDEEEEEF